jgi:hypothetical protein
MGVVADGSAAPGYASPEAPLLTFFERGGAPGWTVAAGASGTPSRTVI